VAADVEREALQQRILGLEVELSDSERLIALRDQELLALQQQLAALEERLDASAAAVQEAADAEPLAPEDVGVGDEADVATGVEAGAGGEASEAPDIAAGGPETVAGTEQVIEEPSLPPTPAPIIGAEAPSVPSDVVTTAPGEESSWLAALFSNIWLYVGLVLVSLAALYVAYRSPAKAKQGGASLLDQLDDTGELDHVSGEPSLGLSSMSTEDESFIVEEVRPAERTMQQDFSAEVDSAAVYDEPATDFVVDEFDESGDSDSGWDMPVAEDESEPEAYSPAAADQESPLERTISISAAADLDAADPIAEADFHMAYGLYDQAADLLTKAVAAEPHRKDLRLKLLEVYFIWENGEGFLKEAKSLQERLEGQADSDWNKVLIMGKQICPDEALFFAVLEGSGEAGAMDLALTEDEQISDDYDVDFPLADVTEESLNISVEDPDEDMSSLDMTNIDRINPDLLNFDLPGDDSTAEAQTLESAMGNLTEDTFDVDLDLADVDFDSEDPTIETPTADMPALKAAAEEEDSFDSPTFEPTQVIQKIEPDESGADDELEVADLEVTDNFIDLENHDLPDMPSLDLAAESLRIDMADDTNIGRPDLEIDEPSVNFDLRGAGFDDDDEAPLFEPTEVMRHSDEDGSGFNDATVEQFTGDTAAQSGSDFEYEGATMTEVGTKLDLARAYIDMGDPEGARSILTEVLEEAGDTQRQQAQQLLSDLG
jgi:pilus assembly protein FimV